MSRRALEKRAQEAYDEIVDRVLAKCSAPLETYQSQPAADGSAALDQEEYFEFVAKLHDELEAAKKRGEEARQRVLREGHKCAPKSGWKALIALFKR